MNSEPYCPICKKDKNAKGEPFSSEWAVALHIAASSKADSRIHTSWLLNNGHLSKEDLLSLSNKDIAEKICFPLEEQLRKLEVESRQLERESSLADDPFYVFTFIEKRLHKHIEFRLKSEFGDEWWHKGVPKGIQDKCADVKSQNLDGEDRDPFDFTTFIQLKVILEENSSIFKSDFEKLEQFFPTRKEFLSQLRQLNDVRNSYAHPNRAPHQGTPKYFGDLAMVKRFANVIDVFTEEST